MKNELSNISIKGFLKVYEEETNNVLLEQHNDIHPENYSLAVAKSLTNNGNTISELAFGNGGVRVSANQTYIYNTPQVINRTATLINETYSKVVDKKSSRNVDVTRNYMTVSHVLGNPYTDILVHCTLEKNEPSGQNVVSGEEIISEYTFSEVGLRTSEDDLITHLCFAPITKQSNITLVFDYLIRVQIV